MSGIFYIGTSPKDAYMLPAGANIMLNARQFHTSFQWKRHGRVSRGGRVFLDCGGYVFFSEYGRFPFTPAAYLNLVAYLMPDYYASMDYPCEPSISSELAGMDVEARIQATVANAVALADMEAMIPGPVLVPVIQGWVIEDYWRCLDLYAAAGLIRPYMAIGSMCTRSNTAEIAELVAAVHTYAARLGVQRLHAFGLKRSEYLDPVQHLIYSRDSAVLYKAPTAEIKRQWNGRQYASGRAEKRQAISYFTSDLTRRGMVWQS